MREIKFRGKRVNNGEWVEGHYTKVAVSSGSNDVIMEQTGGGSFIPQFVDRKTVSQFTGLLDKNGKEIYEGDILQFQEYPPAQVLWYDGAFNARRLDINDDYLLADWYDGTIVIGNIHDNPELMEVE